MRFRRLVNHCEGYHILHARPHQTKTELFGEQPTIPVGSFTAICQALCLATDLKAGVNDRGARTVHAGVVYIQVADPSYEPTA